MSQVLSLSRREPLSDFKGIAKTLSEQSDSELVSVFRVSSDSIVICMEKYFLRTDSYAACTVVLEILDDGTKATVVGFGGGERLWMAGEQFYNVSLGANASLAHEAASVLREYYDFE